jgi:hypothetical protein
MWVECGVGMSAANDLAIRNPEPRRGEAYTGLLCAVGFAYTLFILYTILPIIYNIFLLILFTIYLYNKFKVFLPLFASHLPAMDGGEVWDRCSYFNYSLGEKNSGVCCVATGPTKTVG